MFPAKQDSSKQIFLELAFLSGICSRVHPSADDPGSLCLNSSDDVTGNSRTSKAALQDWMLAFVR